MLSFFLCGFYVNKWSQHSTILLSYPTTFMNQVTQDWEIAPYTDIIVSSDSSCPSTHPNLAMSRKFYGSVIGCDCLGIYSEYITGDNSMVWNEKCDYNQTRYGCRQATPIQPVRQPYFNDTIICAAQEATPFINVTRLQSASLGCPAGTQPCSPFTNATNTICSNDTSTCPITSLQFLTNAAASTLNTADTSQPIYTVVPVNSYYSIAFSKQVDALPVTQTRVS